VFENGAVKNGLLALKELFGLAEETVMIQIGKKDDGREHITNAEALEKGLEQPFPDKSSTACGLVQVRPPKAGWSNDQYVSIGGYLLASRRGRDYGANIHETLVSGTVPKSGGSVKNPNVSLSADCVFEVEVRKDWAIANGFVGSEIDCSALRVERDTLVLRMAEIDAILSMV